MPVGFALALPDLNIGVPQPTGRAASLPVLPAAALGPQARDDPPRRILLLGVLPEFRGKGIDAVLYHWIWTTAAKHGIYWGEAGWILEDNPAMNAGLVKMGFIVYKTLPDVRPAAVKALVTGGTGFVGSHLIESLRRRGDDVTALVRSPAKAAALARAGVRLVEGDLDARDALRRAAEGAEVIYHVAGRVAAKDEAEFLRANRDGTANLLAAAAESGSPGLCWCRAWRPVGPSARGAPLTGAEPPRPVTAYGRSKLAGEAVVRAGALPWVILRPPMVYGPRDTEVLKLFKLARWGVAPVFGKGDQELSAVFGPDLAEALVAAGTSPNTIGKTYLVCHPEVFTSGAFARQIGSAVGRDVLVLGVPEPIGRGLLALIGGAAKLTGTASVLSSEKAAEFFEEAWTGNPAPLMADTGWRASADIARGLAETMAWYRAEGWL